jgi:hypothetical protein
VTIRCQHLKPAFFGQFLLCADPFHTPPSRQAGSTDGWRTTSFSANLRVVVNFDSGKDEASCSNRSSSRGGALDPSPLVDEMLMFVFMLLVWMPAKNARRFRHIALPTVTARWWKARSAYILRRKFGRTHLACAPAAGSTAGDDLDLAEDNAARSGVELRRKWSDESCRERRLRCMAFFAGTLRFSAFGFSSPH